jgi:hypothetical protein
MSPVHKLMAKVEISVVIEETVNSVVDWWLKESEINHTRRHVRP